MSKILVIPDLHVHSNIDYSYIKYIGKFIMDERPDCIVQLGDFCDCTSLSSYDAGTIFCEGQRLINDLKACDDALSLLTEDMRLYNNRRAANRKKLYKPEMYLTLGNHEERLERFVKNNPAFSGLLTNDMFGFEKYGFEVIPFLKILNYNGVNFSHYFHAAGNSNPISNVNTLIKSTHCTSISGHRQGFQYAQAYTLEGKQITAIIFGSAYPHDERYLQQQNARHFRGLLMLDDVENGEIHSWRVCSIKTIIDRYN